jgi:hypothetical protein
MCINIEVKINKHLLKVKLNNLPHRNPFMMRMTGKREGCGELGRTVLFFGISDAQRPGLPDGQKHLPSLPTCGFFRATNNTTEWGEI